MRQVCGFCLVAGLVMMAGAAFGQSGSAAPASLSFVSATVKLSAPPPDTAKVAALMRAMKRPVLPTMGPHVDASQAEYDSMTLKSLIVIAYGMKPYLVSGPAWIADRQFDIVAKMPDGASVNDAPAMLRTLLEDRFKLVVHRETKDQAVLAMVVGKGGPKLTESGAAPAANGRTKNIDGFVMTPEGQIRVVMYPHQGATLESRGMTMPGLADLLTNVLHGGSDRGRQDTAEYTSDNDWRPVVDRTGLTGVYQVAIQTTLDPVTATAQVTGGTKVTWSSRETFEGNGAGVYTPTGDYGVPVTDEIDSMVVLSLQKLGLKLEKSKAPMERLVVDRAEKDPTAN